MAGTKVLGASVGKGTSLLALFAVCAVGGYGAWRYTHPSPVAAPSTAPAIVQQPEVAPPALGPAPIPVESLPLDTERSPAALSKPREPSRARAVESPTAGHEEPAPAAEAPKALSELELVDLARRSIATDPRKTLALAQEHHKRFAGGPLSEEADFLEIEAMKRLGRFEEAKTLDERFRKRYPTSIHGQTVLVKPAPSP
jgi:hypothetical protein